MPIAPVIIKREGTPVWLYNALRRLADEQVQTQRGFGAIIRGEAPDGSGSSLVDKTLFFYKPGLSGGQVAFGATEATGDLTLSSTANATKGSIFLGSAQTSQYDEANQRLGLNVVPLFRLHTKHSAVETMQRWEGPNFSVTGITANGTTTVTSAGLFTNVTNGMVVTGATVPAGTVVATKVNNSTLTLNNAVPAGTGLTFNFALRIDLSLEINGTGTDATIRTPAALQIITGDLLSGLRLTTGPGTSTIERAWIEAGYSTTTNPATPTNENLTISGFNSEDGQSLQHFFLYTTFNRWNPATGQLTNNARTGFNTDPKDFSGSTLANQPDSVHIARSTGAQATVPTVLIEGTSGTTEAISVRTNSGGTAPNKTINGTTLFGVRHDGKIELCGGGVQGLLDGSGPAQITVTDTSGNLFFKVGQVAAWSDTLIAANSRFMQIGYLASTHRAALIDSDGHGVFTRFGVSSQYTLFSNGQAGGAQFPAPDGASPSTVRVYNAATGGFDASVVLKVESARTLQSGNLISAISAVTGNTAFAVDNKAFLQAGIKSNSFFADSTDLTKHLALDVSAIGTGTTVTWTVQNASGTVALLGVAQTWSANQTIGSNSNPLNLSIWSLNSAGQAIGLHLLDQVSGADAYFDTSILTAGSVFTLPDGGGIFLTASATASLTNKTLVGSGGNNFIECSTSGVVFSKGATHTAGFRISTTNLGTTIRSLAYPADLNLTLLGVGNQTAAATAGNLGKRDLTAQGADITTTALTSTPPVGIYNMEVILMCTTADAAAGTLTLTVGWTDTIGATTDASITRSLTATGRSPGIIRMQVASGDITFAVANSGSYGTAKYALYIRLIYKG